jgi:Ca2+-binding EF-hand superfamily protein
MSGLSSRSRSGVMEARLSQRSLQNHGSSRQMKGSLSLPSLTTPKNMSPDEKCKWLQARLKDVEEESKMMEESLSLMDQASNRSVSHRSAYTDSNRSAYPDSNRSAYSNSFRSAQSNSNRSAFSNRSAIETEAHAETKAEKIAKVLQTMEAYMRKRQIRCIDLFRLRNFNQSFDKGDDKLDSQEFKRAIMQMGMDLSSADAQLVVNHLDNNGDGEIDLAELDAIMRQARREALPQDAMDMIAKIARINPQTELMMISHREAKRRVNKTLQKKNMTGTGGFSASLLASCQADESIVRNAVQKMIDLLKSKGLREADLFSMSLEKDTTNSGAGAGAMGGKSFQEQHEMMMRRREKGGYLTKEEFGNLLKKVGLNLSRAESLGIMRRLDSDGNNEIDIKELGDIIKKVKYGKPI